MACNGETGSDAGNSTGSSGCAAAVRQIRAGMQLQAAVYALFGFPRDKSSGCSAVSVSAAAQTGNVAINTHVAAELLRARDRTVKLSLNFLVIYDPTAHRIGRSPVSEMELFPAFCHIFCRNPGA